VIGYVVDASVAVKWCLPAQNELFVPQAQALLDLYQTGDLQFVVPDLFWLEVANALWKAVWKGTIDAPWAEKSYAEVTRLEIPTIASLEFVPKALELAIERGRTVYASLYLALALHSRVDLITADERLANALAARFPVKWLGAF
jgi:predicted nucleic acid-binding protein